MFVLLKPLGYFVMWLQRDITFLEMFQGKLRLGTLENFKIKLVLFCQSLAFAAHVISQFEPRTTCIHVRC